MAQELKAFEVGLGRYCKDGSCCVVAFATGRTPRALNGKIYLKSEADKVIAELKEERRWRKCSEELPLHDTWCLVYHEGEIDSDYYTDDCNSLDRFVMYGHFVTHWMPMPKAPEEAK